MAFDGITIASLVHEFKDTLEGGRISKIAQPEKDELLIAIKNNKENYWSDIVAHHTQLQTIRAIENFDSSSVTVSQGDMKKSVAVEDHVQPVSAMEQLYMKVIVE